MFADSNQEAPSGARKLWRNFSLVFMAVLLYVGWVFFSRWQENREFEQRATAQSDARKSAEDKRVVEMLGGNRFEIQNFYASPGVIRRGETAQLCYGVANAKTVRLEPQTSPVWPSYSRCVDVTPKKDTTYTLTIEDAAGNIKTQTLVVNVR